MRTPSLITKPTADPIDLATAKSYLALIDEDDWDTDIAAYIKVATGILDGYAGVLGTAIVTQTWKDYFDNWDRCLTLSILNPTSIDFVRYTDTNGDEQTVQAENYRLIETRRGPQIEVAADFAFPSRDREFPIEVQYIAGDAAADVPDPIKHAVKMLVLELFEGQGSVNSDLRTLQSSTFKQIIQPYRRKKV